MTYTSRGSLSECFPLVAKWDVEGTFEWHAFGIQMLICHRNSFTCYITEPVVVFLVLQKGPHTAIQDGSSILPKSLAAPGFIKVSQHPGPFEVCGWMEAQQCYSQASWPGDSSTTRTSMAGRVLLASVLLSPRMLPAERPSHS